MQLDGIRVLDLSRVLAGPLAGQLLGDLGAEVIKVERPGSGDESRQYGPPFVKDREGRDTAQSAFFVSANRNKRSITLDLARVEGQAIARRLARQSDVVIENFRVGALARYGLDYETLAADNPGLVYCSITGYGQSGPYRERPGYDSIFQAMSGLMHSIGHPDGAPGGGPLRTGPSLADVFTSLYADIAILGALYRRDAKGGPGEHIDLALLDCTIAAMTHYASVYLVSGMVPPRRGNEGNGGVPSKAFRCSDGAIILTVGNDAQFHRFCHAIDRPDLLEDARFATGPSRIVHRAEIGAILDAVFLERTMAEWLDRLVAADIPVGPIYPLNETFADPHVVARGMAVAASEAGALDVPLVANPIRYANGPVDTYRAPPTVGADTEAVLRDLAGISADELETYRKDGIV